MRDYALTQSEYFEVPGRLSRLKQIWAQFKKRRRLRKVEDLDDRLLADIGLSRFDVAFARSLPLSLDPVAELEKLRNRPGRLGRGLKIR